MTDHSGCTIKSAGKMRASIDLDGVIGYNIDSAQFKSELNALGDVENIKITLNTEGGDVGQSVNIRNTIKEHPASIHIHVVGYALSGGSYILTGADKVTATDDSIIMIHEPESMIRGNADALEDRAQVMRIMTDSVMTGYMEKMNSTEDETRAMLKKTTWFTAAQAREIGLVDKLDKSASSEPAQMRSTPIDVSEYKNAPQEFLNRYAQMHSQTTKDGTPVETTKGNEMTEQVTPAADLEQARQEGIDSVVALMSHANGSNKDAVIKIAAMNLSAEQSAQMMDLVAAPEASTETVEVETESETVEKGATLAEIKNMFETTMKGGDVSSVNTNASADTDTEAAKPVFDATAEYNRLNGAA